MRLPDGVDGVAAQISGVSTFLISIACSCCFVVLTLAMGIKFPWFRRQLRLGTVAQMTATLEANVKKESAARATNVPSQGVFKRWDQEEAGPPPEPQRVVLRKDRPAPPPPQVPRSRSLPPASRKSERPEVPAPVAPRTGSIKETSQGRRERKVEDERLKELQRQANLAVPAQRSASAKETSQSRKERKLEEERIKELKRQEMLRRKAEEKAMRKSDKSKKRATVGTTVEPVRVQEPQVSSRVSEPPPLPASSPPSTSQAPALPPKEKKQPKKEEKIPARVVSEPPRVEEPLERAVEPEQPRVVEAARRTPEPPVAAPEIIVNFEKRFPRIRPMEPPPRFVEPPPPDAFVVSGTEVKGKKKEKKKDKKKSKEKVKSAPPTRRNPRALEPELAPPSVEEAVLFEKVNGATFQRSLSQEGGPSHMSLQLPQETVMVPRSPRPTVKSLTNRPRLPAKKKAAPRAIPVAPPRIYTPPATPPPKYESPEPDMTNFERDGVFSFRLPDSPEPMEVHPSFLALVRPAEESDECDA
ncbi:hepatoma-derived growth factor-related protein 2-like [Neocloeon triangulifer]|uniref:hepatoma-derived growth factor-related protein 2-like n=1 Tax=Neocloeon triangulifer TaxID=2078957 RepID=UPI00286F8E4B|nr:hepatoma-derived growth factor-related protein 2-like [Neocloeon triangulifer]